MKTSITFNSTINVTISVTVLQCSIKFNVTMKNVNINFENITKLMIEKTDNISTLISKNNTKTKNRKNNITGEISFGKPPKLTLIKQQLTGND